MMHERGKTYRPFGDEQKMLLQPDNKRLQPQHYEGGYVTSTHTRKPTVKGWRRKGGCGTSAELPGPGVRRRGWPTLILV